MIPSAVQWYAGADLCNHKLVNLFSYTTSSVSEIRRVSCKRIVFLPRLNDVSGSLWLELRSLWSLYCNPFNLGFVNTNCKPWLQGYGSAECKDLAGMHALVVRISCGRCWCRACWADEFTVNWLVRPKCLYPAIIGIQLRMIPCIWLWRHLTSPQWFYKYLLMAVSDFERIAWIGII